MRNALHYEWVRLRTLRSTWFLLGGALALQFVFASMYAGHDDLTPREKFVFPFTGITLTLVALLPTAVAVASFGHEYRYRTITTTALTLRSPGKVLAAKVLTVVAAAASTGVGLIAVTLLADLLRGEVLSEMWRVGQVLFAVVLYTALSSLVGLGIAAVTRNATIAMVTVLSFPTIVEVLLVLGLDVNQRLMPFSSAAQLVKLEGEGTMWTLPLPLLTLAVGLVATAGVLLTRRDA